MRALKLTAYRLARALGLFALARVLTRDRLRILAYHGFAGADELRFRPKLFISLPTFERRLEQLRRRRFEVITLDEAVSRLRCGQAFRGALAITVDDGYASTLDAAALLHEHGMPATVYITSYHVETQTPVFDLVVGYMLWRCRQESIDLVWPLQGALRTLPTRTARDKDAAVQELIALGRAASGEPARVALCEALGAACGVPYTDVQARGTFRLMNSEELGVLAGLGISVGLHTHRHRFPPDDLAVCRGELHDNEVRLQRWLGSPSRHFCYPSGVYSVAQWRLLDELGIPSTTTCDTGLVRAGDPPHGLKRFLDGEMVDEVEFDAEVCGFSELLRTWLRPAAARVAG